MVTHNSKSDMPLAEITIRANAQEVSDKLNKDYGTCQLGREMVTHNSKSDMPLITL